MDLKSLRRIDVELLADTPKVFRSGVEYEQSGAITQFSRTPNGISARVQGNYGKYALTISNDLELNCNCPYEGSVCKHLIAVLLKYLDDGNPETASAESGAASAFEQTLEAMPEDELRQLVLRLTQEQPDFRRVLLDNMTILPALLRQQPHDPKQVKYLKKEIDRAVEAATQYDGEGYDSDYGVSPDLNAVLDAAEMLHPEDQTEIYWYIVTSCNAAMDDNVSDEPIQEAIPLYADAVAGQELPSKDKRYYLDTLLDTLHWPMCDYGTLIEPIKAALDTIATTPEDVEYLILKLDKLNQTYVQDWIIGYYKKLGDDKRYLDAREANLFTASQYLDLADYWLEKGDEAQSVATLEAWVTLQDSSDDRSKKADYRFARNSNGEGEVLERLIAHYDTAGDDANLERILRIQARKSSVTLARYQRIQSVSTRRGTWPEPKPELLDLAYGVERARIYLHEQEWTEAIEFARLSVSTYDQTCSVVADAVKERHPKESIELYNLLVQAGISQAKRDGYHVAASYAVKIKAIYLTILKDKAAWEDYVGNIRNINSHRPALKDEFRGL